ncbi:MAG: lysophospholipase [Candidatus Liberibacter europaeus]|uniref:Lysophospholipase n=1 Tax=Candidatus Liberibacter europaeus TaxID=744859 RepID=A0A2T4VY14_9HYPH|nr:lysophospholipase [Candidatus Liberibacter europaeus]PTL86669.1 MAG: lysophospholipase [Candidatus Liberibacter europaeus]
MKQKTLLLENIATSNITYSHHQTLPSSPRAAILICQSIEENSTDYNLLCKCLTEENLAVYIYSYQDVKKTPNIISSIDYDKQNVTTTITQDVMKLRKLISENHGNIPVLLLGYSLGTIIALSTLISYPNEFSGIALWNLDLYFEKYNCLIIELVLKAEKFFKGSDVPSRFMHHVTSSILTRNKQNWKYFLNNPSSNLKSKTDGTINHTHYLNIPISTWLELMSLSNNINSVGSFNSLSRYNSFCLIGGGNAINKVEDNYQMYNLAQRLQSEEFYDVSLIILPPDPIDQLQNKVPDRAIKTLLHWIVKSYLPKITPLITHHME